MSAKIERLLVCTHNKGKLKEIMEMLEGLSIEILTPESFPDLPDPIEDGDSFLANAHIKALSAFEHTGIPSLADDSGLVVPSLDGAPGIFSARYANANPEKEDKDQANRTLLRENLRSKSSEERAAYFMCTMVFYRGEDVEEHFEGRCHGQIIDEERGDNGFGYDPIFFVPSLQKTFAQIPSHQKNEISHRAHALKKFRNWLENEIEQAKSDDDVCGHEKYLFHKTQY